MNQGQAGKMQGQWEKMEVMSRRREGQQGQKPQKGQKDGKGQQERKAQKAQKDGKGRQEQQVQEVQKEQKEHKDPTELKDDKPKEPSYVALYDGHSDV